MTAMVFNSNLLPFEIYCAGNTVDEGGYTQMSGCGIISKLYANCKKYGYALGPTNSIKASALSIKLGVLTISKSLRNKASGIIIYSDSKILNLLSDDMSIQDLTIEPIVLEIRDLIRPFGSRIAFEDYTNPLYIKASEIAKYCQEKQRDYKQ